MTNSTNSLIDEVMERIARKHHSKQAASTTSEHDIGNEHQRALVRALKESTQGIFSTMVGWTVEPGTLGQPERNQHFAASGIIGLSGRLKATIAVRFEQDFLFEATQAFLGVKPTELVPDVIDLVGELTNMIGGNAKERLCIPGVVLGLPTVVAGQGHYVAFESCLHLTHMPFSCDKGSMSVELGINV